MTGLPAMSVPTGLVDDLPVGIQLVADDEHALFAAARALTPTPRR
ncbi:MAG TPA: hypothetical protein VGL02_04820 [Streptomyces sp.]